MDNSVLILTNDEHKKCSHCGRVLPVTSFYRHNGTKSGYQPWCIECKKIYDPKRRAFREARRIGFFNKSASELLKLMYSMKYGELCDLKRSFLRAAELVDREIKKKHGK